MGGVLVSYVASVELLVAGVDTGSVVLVGEGGFLLCGRIVELCPVCQGAFGGFPFITR